MQRIASGSIVVGILVLAMKAAAWWMTGSAALYSDALESVVNVIASLMAFAALIYAARPADDNHPYGHEKVEFFSAAIEGALIIVAALSILQHAWVSWRDPVALDAPWLALGLTAVSTLFNGGWAAVLMRTGRLERSTALVADAKHLYSDVVTSVGILIGIGLVLLTGLRWLDPLLAAATAVHVLWSGLTVIRSSVAGLMDEAPDSATMERIRRLVNQHAAGAIEAHDLRTRHAGRLTYLEFHLVVPGEIRVDEAHAICDRVEGALKAEVEGLIVTIHVEPEGKAKHRGVLVL
ncbi:MAG: cation diffusion facilitator family transporter [Janthinobacterium lividum]